MNTANSLKRDDVLRFKPDDKVGDYRIISQGRALNEGYANPLGQGGSGIVYLAEQEFDKDAIIKRAIKFFMFRDDIAKQTEHGDTGIVSLTNYRDELMNLASINHENIIKIIQVGAWEHPSFGVSIPYIVTDYIEGPTLKDVIENQTIEDWLVDKPALAMDLIIQLCRGLAHLHSRNFYHCDIAPKNVFLRGKPPEVNVVIGDLGVGRVLPINGSDDVFVIGSREYCPKEVYDNLNKYVSPHVFNTFQPKWDLFATVKTIQAIVNSLESEPKIRRPWQTALKQKLEPAIRNRQFTSTRLTSAENLLSEVQWLNPSRHTLAETPELSESHPGNRNTLLPVESVTLSHRARAISQHPSILRLKKVPQILMASAIFPGATHSRYEHTLGTYQVIRRYMQALMDDENFLAMFSPKYVELTLVASLLSNATHYPFALVVNEIRHRDSNALKSLSRESLLRKLLQWPTRDSSNQTLEQVISANFPLVDLEQLIWILTDNPHFLDDPGTRFIHKLLNSSLDARVLDYLRRDPIHLGISSGNTFDLISLLRNIRFRDGNMLVLHQGLSIVEQVITLRYWSFNRVYWNSPNRSLTVMIKYVMASLICARTSINRELGKIALHATETSILQSLRRLCTKKSIKNVELCTDLLHDHPNRFVEIGNLSRAEGPAQALEIYKKLPKVNLRRWVDLQNNLNQHIATMWSLPAERVHILADLPIEAGRRKLGEDINIESQGDREVPLGELSEIVSGAQRGFTRQLQRLRIFMNPRTAEHLNHETKPVFDEVYRYLKDRHW